MSKRIILSWLLIFIVGISSGFAAGKLETSEIFSDNMVLQRDQPNLIWGTAKADSQVSIQFVDKTIRTTVDSGGSWQATLPSLVAGGPYEMEISSGEESLFFTNILIGEVWLCSGQSNMEWNISQFGTPEKWIREAESFPQVRLVTVKRRGLKNPTREVQLELPWSVCDSKSVEFFSAVAYHFGKELNLELGVPIGLISSNLGAAAIECFIPENILNNNPKTASIFPAFKQKYPTGRSLPWFWVSGLYNAMIHPLVGYGIKGAIWYQGEGNIFEPEFYSELQPLLVETWKKEWKMEQFPFIYAQIAPYNYADDLKFNSYRVMEIQDELQFEIPDSKMIVTADIGEWKDIHPKNKHDVGWRMAQVALATTYDQPVVYASPRFREALQEGDSLRLYFDNADELLLKEGHGFEVAGEDGVFVPAVAEVDGNTIVVVASGISAPKYVRYGWICEKPLRLYNENGFPSAPFRNDSFSK